MKRIFFCLIGVAALCLSSMAGSAPQAVQPFSAVMWTTTTLHSPSGKSFIFTRRTVYTRDASGNVRRELYLPTKGLQHDTTSPLERVLTGSTSTQTMSTAQSLNEKVEQDVDLGTLQFSGLPANGRRQSFQDATSQRTRTVETWFCPTLGLIVHTERANSRGDTVVSDLSELHLGNPSSSEAEAAPAVSRAIPLLHLYRGLFALIANMERDRQANNPDRHVNMDEIEDHLRKKLDLSASEWRALVVKSVQVETYTQEMSKQAHTLADQYRASRQQNPLSSQTAGRATLRKMQLDLNTHVQGEIDDLKQAVGPTATDRIQTYLQGPLAASTHVLSSKSARLQAQQAEKERSQ